jgi:hypothetical protein
MCTRSLFIKDTIPPSPSWSKASDFDSDTPSPGSSPGGGTKF